MGLVPGIRVQASKLGELGWVWTVDPRLSESVALSERSELRASVGLVSQLPETRELLGDLGVPTLLPERAVQATLGWDTAWTEAFTTEFTAFYTALDDLVVGHEDRVELTLSPAPQPPLDLGRYANDGTGRIFGVESLLRLDTPRSTGWIALTWSRSLRTERPGQAEGIFNYDQPLIAQLLFSQALGRGWRAGTRARYGSGNPHTPVTNHALDLSDLSWVPVFDTEQSGRLPPWWAIDLRVDKTWPLRGWELRASLDLQNATNRRNVEMVTWTRDYTQELQVWSLPLLPVFGLEATW